MVRGVLEVYVVVRREVADNFADIIIARLPGVERASSCMHGTR